MEQPHNHQDPHDPHDPSEPPVPEPPALADLLVRVAREYLRQESRDLECVAIGPSQYALLELIGAEPGLCPTVLAERLQIDKAAVTRAVRRLESNGFVGRQRSERDQRAWELYLLKAGNTALRTARPGDFSPADRMVFGFDGAGRRRLHKDLQRLAGNLGTDVDLIVRWKTCGTLERRAKSD